MNEASSRATTVDSAVTVDVGGPQDLPDLTARLNAACDAIEDGQPGTVLVLRLDSEPLHERAWPGQVSIQQVNRWEKALRRLDQAGAVIIAVAAGTCAGPTLELLLAADFRISAPDLELLLPVNDGHFWPGMVLQRLVQHLGFATARRIVVWGDCLSAAQAERFGLVDRITEDPDAAARTASVMMSHISDGELAIRRRLLLEDLSAPYEEALGAHLAACARELARLGRPAGQA